MATIPKVFLKPGRSKSMEKRHPWIFSGAIDKVEGNPQPGDTVAVHAENGAFLAYGAYSPHSQIRVRVWSWNKRRSIDDEFFRDALTRALKRRSFLPADFASSADKPTADNALRLVFSESDGLPGLIVDRYGDVLVAQFLTAGCEKWKKNITDQLVKITGVTTVFERSDPDERKMEGLSEKTGLLRGELASDILDITENNLRFKVNIREGHKTGFYLDQRENRLMLRDFCKDREVLNCFSYTGGFTLNALAGGAKSVVSVDSSGKALELAKENVKLNNLPENRCEWKEADVFNLLRAYRDDGRFFDVIVLDPPKFASGTASLDRALRGYKDINLLAFKLLRPGGFLVTFSCSGAVNDETFQKTIAWATLDAGVQANIVKRLTQGPDHPVALNFPESAYLKGLIVQTSP